MKCGSSTERKKNEDYYLLHILEENIYNYSLEFQYCQARQTRQKGGGLQ